MKKLIGSLLAAMMVIAMLYCNYHAVKDSVPFFQRQYDRVTNSKLWNKVHSWIHRVTNLNMVQGTKTKVSNAGGRVIHMFKRSEKTA